MLTIRITALSAIFTCSAAYASSPTTLPAPGKVQHYEWCGRSRTWRTISRDDGEAIARNLIGLPTFPRWPTNKETQDFIARGGMIDPVPTTIGFRTVDADGKALEVHLSRNADLVEAQDSPLYEVPAENAKAITALLAKLDAAEDQRITSQKLPTQYTLGTADDGGTLSGVARLFYHDARKWKLIWQANKDRIPDADKIPGRVTLTIPAPITPTTIPQ